MNLINQQRDSIIQAEILSVWIRGNREGEAEWRKAVRVRLAGENKSLIPGHGEFT